MRVIGGGASQFRVTSTSNTCIYAVISFYFQPINYFLHKHFCTAATTHCRAGASVSLQHVSDKAIATIQRQCHTRCRHCNGEAD